MSASGPNAHQLQQDIQNELNTANQLLNLISMELTTLKNFTCPGGELESTIKQNTSLMSTLANLQHVDLENVPQMVRIRTEHQEQSARRNESEMDEH